MQAAATILIVDDDAVLGRVVGQALAAVGHAPAHAANVAEALEWTERRTPALALLDLHLPDGNGLDLAWQLRVRHPELPLVLMTGDPQSLAGKAELTAPFAAILTKPLDVTEVRRVVVDALAGKPIPRWMEEAAPETVPSMSAVAKPTVASRGKIAGSLRSAAVGLLGLAAILFLAVFVLGVPVPGWSAAVGETTVPAPPPLAVKLVAGLPHTLEVPDDVRTALGIRKGAVDQVAVARPPTAAMPLLLPGSTALDPNRLMRVRARFAPAEVVEIGQVPDETARDKHGMTVFRELRSGDPVRKGALLGVFYSVDVGSKKSDLVDALAQLRLDQDLLERAEKASGAVPEVLLLTYRRNVEGDRNAIARARNTLKTWNIPEADIQAVYEDAKKIRQRGGKRDRTKEFEKWARVELRAPDDGIVLERNVTQRETVVDNTLNLFQIAKVDRLLVLANAPEDDLPALLKLTHEQRRWTVRTTAAPASEGLPGVIDDIGYLIDVNQHNAVVKGHIDNSGGRLRAGQFISARIEMPPPEEVVEIPIRALVDDGRQCVVFVQPDPAKPQYTLRRVEVTHRFDRTAFVRSRLTTPKREKEEGLLPPAPLRPGERVLTAGVLELKKELEDRETRAEN